MIIINKAIFCVLLDYGASDFSEGIFCGFCISFVSSVLFMWCVARHHMRHFRWISDLIGVSIHCISGQDADFQCCRLRRIITESELHFPVSTQTSCVTVTGSITVTVTVTDVLLRLSPVNLTAYKSIRIACVYMYYRVTWPWPLFFVFYWTDTCGCHL
jgi:hypothetical protein